MGYGLEAGQEAMTAGRAAGSGGILNMAALRSLTETTDKSLKIYNKKGRIDYAK